MDQRLLEAAKLGETQTLDSLLREEPEALDKVSLLFGEDTPLHIATLSGKTHFAKAVIQRNPGFAWETNQNGLTPLHLACALGHDDIVDALLGVGSSSLCLVRDNKGRVPLHYAVITGKVGIIEKLLLQCPETLKVVTDKRETCLHLALVNKHVDAFNKLLDMVGDDLGMLYAKNEHGFNIYKLAEETGQLQALPSLRMRGKSFFASLKLIVYSAKKFSIDANLQSVIASLIATVTFQAAANPPPSIWKEDLKLDYTCLETNQKFNWHRRQYTICPAYFYLLFMAFNSLGFLCSIMFIIAFNTGTLAKFCMITSLASLTMSYLVLVGAMSPDLIAAFSTVMTPWCLISVVLYITVIVRMRSDKKQRETLLGLNAS